MHLTLPMISTILALSGMIIACIALVIGCLAYIKTQAIEASTHSIQYMPIDPAVDAHNEELLNKDKSWATSEETLQKQHKLYTEEIEEEMPNFALTDEDKEIISFQDIIYEL